MKFKISILFILVLKLSCAPQKKAPNPTPSKLTQHLMPLNKDIEDPYDEVRCCLFKLEDLKTFFFDRKEIEANKLLIAKIITSLKEYNDGPSKFVKRTQPCRMANNNLEALLASSDYEQMSESKRFEQVLERIQEKRMFNNEYLMLQLIIPNLDLNFIKANFEKSNLETKQLLLKVIDRSIKKDQREKFFTESFTNRQEEKIRRSIEFMVKNSKKKGYKRHWNPCDTSAILFKNKIQNSQ